MAKIGVIVSNLGTPDSTSEKDLKKYLDEFLMDPYVIDIPYPLRVLLIRGIILRNRPKESAEAYKKIWTERGSPLLFHTIDLAKKVQDSLGTDEYYVNIAMRYGKPSIRSALEDMKEKGVSEIQFLPLYPQYSLAATESSKQKFLREAKKLKIKTPLKVLNPFYDNSDYMSALCADFKKRFDVNEFDYFMLSYHGVPERHVQKTDPSKKHCLVHENCCSVKNENNRMCYRHHCFENAKQILNGLGIPEEKSKICFQSRLGKDPWIQPFTDVVFEEVAKMKDVKKIACFSPAFVADCLETIEEIGMRGNEDVQAIDSSKSVTLVPSLNSNDEWAACLTKWCSEQKDSPEIWENF